MDPDPALDKASAYPNDPAPMSQGVSVFINMFNKLKEDSYFCLTMLN